MSDKPLEEPSEEPPGDSAAEQPVRAVPKPTPKPKKSRSGFSRGKSKPKTENLPVCPLHGATMFSRDGGTRFSHQLADGTWCSGVAEKKTETFEEYAERLGMETLG